MSRKWDNLFKDVFRLAVSIMAVCGLMVVFLWGVFHDVPVVGFVAAYLILVFASYGVIAFYEQTLPSKKGGNRK